MVKDDEVSSSEEIARHKSLEEGELIFEGSRVKVDRLSIVLNIFNVVSRSQTRNITDLKRMFIIKFCKSSSRSN